MKKATYSLIFAGGALLMIGFAIAFLVAPIAVSESGKELFNQKIFYYHAPVAETSLLAFLLGAVFGALFLIKKERKYDFLSLAAVELGFVFGMLVEFTGVMWDKAAWGVWWQWEPRLTTYLILMLVYAAYFVLRSAVSEDSTKARFGAVYAILAAVTVPLTFLSIRLIPSIHPIVIDTGGAHMEGPMLAAFLISMFGMTTFFVALLLMRYQAQLTAEEVDYLKNELGG
ncbi:MAG TPA: cytochrome c biogenesis protein CcsA [Candidatus Aquicultor sp.]|jgi:heme exporter protein C